MNGLNKYVCFDTMIKYYLQTIVFVTFNEISVHGLFKSVTRQSESDFFVKSSCKSDCDLYGGYCFDVKSNVGGGASSVGKSTCCSCKCEWGKTFYGLKNSAYCFDGSLMIKNNDCRYVQQNDVFYVSKNSTILQDNYQSVSNLINVINTQTKINIMSCTLLKNASYWEPFRWSNLSETSVFRLSKNTNSLEMRNVELYKGYLFKLFISCNNFTSCLLLKVLGENIFKSHSGNPTTLRPVVNVTLIPLKTIPKSTKKKKSTTIIIIVTIVILFVILFIASLLVLCKRKLKRKNVSSKDHMPDATQVQLINSEIQQASNHCVRTFDDSAYVDPSICIKSAFERKSLFIEANALLKNEVENNDTKNTEEKKNYPDYVNPNFSLSNAPEIKKDLNYELPIIKQITVKDKHNNNEYESCGQVPTHEYVDITAVNDAKSHYYTDPDKALQNYKKERLSKYTNPDSQDSNEKNNSGYTKLLPNVSTSTFKNNEPISSEPKNESNNSQYTFLMSDSFSNAISNDSKSKNHSNSNLDVNPSGYARLSIINNKTSEDSDPKYYLLEPDDSNIEDIAI